MPETTFTRNAWSGVLNLTRETYLSQKVEEIKRSRLLFAMLQKKGRITHGRGGTDFTWLFDYKLPQPLEYGDAQTPNFTRQEYTKQATIGARSYYVTDQVTWHNEQQNKGQDALGSLVGQKLNKLGNAMEQYLNGQAYIDGYASGNTRQLIGLESMMGTGTTVATDILAKPDDDYGTVATDVATFGGNWSTDRTVSPNANIATDWPFGSGLNGQLDVQYDVWSPKIWNWSSTGWGTSSTTWKDNCLILIRTAVANQRRLLGNDGQPDLFLTEDQMCIDGQEALEPRFRIQSPHKASEELGFGGMPQYEGMGIDVDYNCPANSGYMLPVKKMELFTQTKKLFAIDGPTWSARDDANLFIARFLGNFRFDSPRFFAKAENVA